MALVTRYYRLLTNYVKMSMLHQPVVRKLFNQDFPVKGYVLNNKRCAVQLVSFYCVVPYNNSTILSSRYLENKLIELYMNFSKNGRVSFHDLQPILSTYEGTNRQLHTDVSLLLLKSCGEVLFDVSVEKRQELTMRVWDLINKKKCQLTLEHYNALLSVFAENSQALNPSEFLESMTVIPDQSTYDHLLNAMAKHGNSDMALNIINTLKKHYPPNETMFSALVEAYAIQGNIAAAYKVIDSMQQYHITPSSKTYTSLTIGFIKNEDILSLKECLEKHKLDTKDIMKIVKNLSQHKCGKHISDILKYLKLPLEKDPVIINTIIALTFSNQITDARTILDYFSSDPNIKDMIIIFADCFLKKEIESVVSNDVVSIVDYLMEWEDYPHIITKAAEVALYCGQENQALKVFKKMKEKSISVRSHYYWPILLQTSKHKDENEIYTLVEHMKMLNVKIDNDTWVNYVFSNINTTKLDKVIKRFENIGMLPSTIFTPFLSFLIGNSRIADATLLAKKLRKKVSSREIIDPLLQEYRKTTDIAKVNALLLKLSLRNKDLMHIFLNALLKGASNNENDVRLIYNLLELFKKHEIKTSDNDIILINKQILNIGMDEKDQNDLLKLSNSLNKCESNDSRLYLTSSIFSPTPHKKKMSSDELACHLIELKNKNMNTRGVLRQLLLAYNSENNLKGAEKIKEEIISNNIEWSAAMKISLFDLYIKNDMLDEANVVLNDIQTQFSSFKIDNYKIINYITILVKHGKLRDAFIFLEKQQNVTHNANIVKDCNNLLTILGNSKDFMYAEEMLHLLVKKGFCNISNVLLGSVIEAYLLHDDIASAVDKFKKFVEKYRRTPQKQRLIIKLIRNANSSQHMLDQLNEVCYCIKKINGYDILQMCLIIGLAECGITETLKKSLKEFNVSSKLLMEQLKFFSVEEKLLLLTTIFEAGKEIQYSGLTSVCDAMLSIYNERSDDESIIALWEKMQIANVKPSNLFKNSFIRLQNIK